MHSKTTFLAAAILLSGCADHFAVLNVAQPASIAPPAGQRAYDARVTPRDLYTVVWAEVAPPASGSPLQSCGDQSVLASVLSTRTRSLVVSADISPGVSLPLYAVSQDGAASCSISLGQIYVSTRQVVDPGLPFHITCSAVVDDSGSERLSGYLTAAVAFGNLLAPLGPQIGVVTSAMNTMLQSAPAKQLSQETSALLGSRTTLSGTPLVAIDPPQSSDWYERTYPYALRLQRYGYANRPKGAPVDLGQLTLHVWRTSTIIGADPVSDGDALGALPSYGNLSPQTQLLTLTSAASGMTASQQNLFALLDQDGGVATAVKGLQPDATSQQVAQVCGNLRQVIQKQGLLNRFDAAAYLWAVYSWSAYAAAHEPARPAPGYVSPCLTLDEQGIVMMVGQFGGPRAGT